MVKLAYATFGHLRRTHLSLKSIPQHSLAGKIPTSDLDALSWYTRQCLLPQNQSQFRYQPTVFFVHLSLYFLITHVLFQPCMSLCRRQEKQVAIVFLSRTQRRFVWPCSTNACRPCSCLSQGPSHVPPAHYASELSEFDLTPSSSSLISFTTSIQFAHISPRLVPSLVYRTPCACADRCR